MSQSKVAVNQINIVAKNFDATLRFYRMFGLKTLEPMDQPSVLCTRRLEWKTVCCSRLTTNIWRASTTLVFEARKAQPE